MDDVYETIEEYSSNIKCKILVVFDYIIADLVGNDKLNPIVTELFIRGRTFNLFLYTILLCCTKEY